MAITVRRPNLNLRERLYLPAILSGMLITLRHFKNMLFGRTKVTMQYPDPGTLYPGDPFTLFTSFVPASGGSLTTSSPHARVTVDAIVYWRAL